MRHGIAERAQIIEAKKGDPNLPKLRYSYSTSGYYDVLIRVEQHGWSIELLLKALKSPVKRDHTSALFKEHVNEPRAFAAVLDGRQVGWIELGHEAWNNRMRVWEFLVADAFRRIGVGKLLMNHAIGIAREKGARMLVLETQSCNVPAIAFYLGHGFKLIGFDSAAYSNEDIDKKEVRFEFGLPLQRSGVQIPPGPPPTNPLHVTASLGRMAK